jgi:ABC-type dipeptide/oligopeptide/nickel transport system permease component
VQGCILVIAASFVLANALADVVNAWLDPRIGAAAARGGA